MSAQAAKPLFWQHETCVDAIERLQSLADGTIPEPYAGVDRLVKKYLKGSGRILDVGCEIGANAACMIRAGHRVVLLDIAANAVQYSRENLEQKGLAHGIEDSIVCKIEELPPKHTLFRAVVGGSVFSCISPHLFDQVMKDNVLGRVEPGGYFVGRFFGQDHALDSLQCSVLTREKLKVLFSSMGFSVCEMQEDKETILLILRGKCTTHFIDVIAQRIPK